MAIVFYSICVYIPTLKPWSSWVIYIRPFTIAVLSLSYPLRWHPQIKLTSTPEVAPSMMFTEINISTPYFISQVRKRRLFLVSLCSIHGWYAISDLSVLLDPVDAAYNRNGPIAKCLQGTREQLIATIVQWIDGDMDHPICWLNGPAGFGKSAVSHSHCRTVQHAQQTCRQFSFSFEVRETEAESRVFIPTLVYQLSVSVPATKPFMQSVLQGGPADYPPSAQLSVYEAGWLKPILSARNYNLAPPNPMVCRHRWAR